MTDSLLFFLPDQNRLSCSKSCSGLGFSLLVRLEFAPL